ncbi:lasso peptide biosynthesis B2 protein [Oleisolibacter albus]|uniref:lasso peptide biosynthesis B2 protein n=1 Tax=Oleisolibacter albus TaxID=2171757 RepID=UPI000DF317D3|nr:lasso peptide biosynthesis B2 protein [Oleisolibacter albus]
MRRRTRWRRPPADYGLLAEAVLCLAVARLALLLLPFRTLARLMVRAGGDRESGLQAPERVRRVGWAVRTAARRGPVPAVCFPQGLAAQMMLARRRVGSRLYYGLKQADGALKAHVWVRAAGCDVVGGREAPGFAVVATFPPMPAEQQQDVAE